MQLPGKGPHRYAQALVKHFAEDLGFEYLSASNEQEFKNVYERFLVAEITDRPILFEVFTKDVDETKALDLMINMEKDVKVGAKNFAKKALGKKGVAALKKVVKR